MTMRWSKGARRPVEDSDVDKFLKEVFDVCRKHGFCIEHEDNHGGFIIELYHNEQDLQWLNEAMLGKSIKTTR